MSAVAGLELALTSSFLSARSSTRGPSASALARLASESRGMSGGSTVSTVGDDRAG
jgi:hypothetical protein